jgi:ABC-type transport system involved in multi-copper enzyme maturation permease subunit
MHTIWHSLAWKEWHEHKWKLAAMTAILCGVLAVIVVSAERDAIGVCFALLMYAALPLAVFLGASEAADERGRRTLPLLESLPVATWKHACWKLTFGVATCVVPIGISIAFAIAVCVMASTQQSEIWRDLRRLLDEFPPIVDFGNPLANWGVSSGLLAAVASVSVFLWSAAAGVRGKDQARAGVMALAVIAAWWTVVGFTAANLDPDWLRGHGSVLAAIVMGISPAGLLLVLAVVVNGEPFPIPVAIAAGSVFHIALAVWFITRYGQSAETDRYSRRTSVDRRWEIVSIGLPRRHPLTAIAWKQFRESAPIALAGLAGIAAFFAANVLTSYEFYAEHESRYVGLLESITLVIGFMVATAVGIGVFDRDLGPKINEFWRSRPIHPDLWFWTKYLTGLGVLFVVLYLPLLAGGGTLAGPFVSIGADERQMLYFHVAIYAAALAGICLVRQPIYAAILGIATILAGTGVVYYLVRPGEERLEVTLLAIEMGMAVTATLTAWLAVRYDWGRKNG